MTHHLSDFCPNVGTWQIFLIRTADLWCAIEVSLTFPLFVYLKWNMPCKIYREPKIMQIIELALPVKTTKVLGVGGRTIYPSQNTRNKNYSTSLEEILVKIAAQDHKYQHSEMKHLIQQIQPGSICLSKKSKKDVWADPLLHPHKYETSIIKKSLEILGFLMAATRRRPKKDYRF